MDRVAVTRPSSVQDIFILRPDNLGDVVLFSGALRAVRGHFPNAKITLCTRRYTHNLLELCPHIDRLVAWESVSGFLINRFPLLKGMRGVGPLYAWLCQYANRQFQPDLLLLPVRSPNPEMHVIAQTISAKAKYSICGDNTNQALTSKKMVDQGYTDCLRLTPESYQTHELDITKDFLNFLGLSVCKEDIWPEFWTAESDRQWAAQHMAGPGDAVSVAICPGATTGGDKKFYPSAHYAEAFNQLRNGRFAVTLFGSSAERDICQSVADALSNCARVVHIQNLAGATTIRQLVESFRFCDLVISQETGALHMAVGLRKPTIGIMGGGHYGRFYPWGNPAINRVVDHKMNCYWCHWQCKYSTMRCIQEIEPGDIAAAIHTVLNVKLKSS
ncbi:MAG: glycosyltransferase family 9 protein [Caldilineaceae bacterium]|nr:glycosyltransferase family 9 protein [Caldilineaceae bacterium]